MKSVPDEAVPEVLSRAIGHCLRAMALTGNAEKVEQCVAVVFVQPFLQDTFTVGRVDAGSRRSFQGLANRLEEFQAFVQSKLLWLVKAAETVVGVDIVGRSIWGPLLHHLHTTFQQMWSPAFVDVFHRVRSQVSP